MTFKERNIKTINEEKTLLERARNHFVVIVRNPTFSLDWRPGALWEGEEKYCVGLFEKLFVNRVYLTR